VNRRAVLSCWQACHTTLDEGLRVRFLARPEVEELATMGDETVRMAVRAHTRLRDEVLHARWLSARRLGSSGCGCAEEGDEEPQAVGHRLVLLPGPDTRTGGGGVPRTATVMARCSCGWERRAADGALLRTLWRDHVLGDEEEPPTDW
jgi:hypothetical protein